MRKIEREVYLKVLDTLWMQHLENMQHLREGIHWRSVGQRDPLVEYRSESQKLFDGLEKSLREEVLKILLSLTKLEAQSEKLTDGQEYESELTKMAEGATEKGVNEISAGEKNLDKEFKENSNTSNKSGNNPNLNQQRNMARKDKKKQRQNKKKGKQQ
jgi:preprotein translocase subunit SecA